MSRPVLTSAMAAALLLAGAARASAQNLRWVDHTGHYGAIGGGQHSLELSCDSLCPTGTQGTGSFEFALGRHITRRMRFELGASVGMNTDRRSTFLSAGVASYLVSGLYVRGGVTLTQLSLTDSTSTTFDFRGGPGFLVGGGFDVPLGHTWALTPWVNYTASTAKAIDVSGGRTTSGSFHSLNFGVTLTRLAGTYLCTTRAGERVWVKRRYRVRALACLAQVEAGIAQRSGIKL